MVYGPQQELYLKIYYHIICHQFTRRKYDNYHVIFHAYKMNNNVTIAFTFDNFHKILIK